MYSVRVTLPPKDEFQCTGFKVTKWRLWLYRIICVLSLGLLPLIVSWFPSLFLVFCCYKSPIYQSRWVRITNVHGQSVIVAAVYSDEEDTNNELLASVKSNVSMEKPIHQSSNENIPLLKYNGILMSVTFQSIRLVWTGETLEPLSGLTSNSVSKLKNRQPLTNSHIERLRSVHGTNEIPVPVKSYLWLLVNEVINPFYVFQVISIGIWCMEDYYTYSVVIAVTSVFSLFIEVYEIRSQSVTLSKMAGTTGHLPVTVLRFEHGEVIEYEIESKDLVPGDIIVIPRNGCEVTCDAVMLQGTCIVNEAMLTGESVAVGKSPLSTADGTNTMYQPLAAHRRSTVFCGTRVLQSNYYRNEHVLAVVVKTGFYTAKGELVRSILYPRPVGFAFYSDAMRFILCMSVLAFTGTGLSFYLFQSFGFSFFQTMVKSLDILTIVVPPALPAAMTIGIVYATSRLKKGKIFSTSPARINVAGKVKMAIFDKTGTITEDGLDFWGYLPLKGKGEVIRDLNLLPATDVGVIGMASCHSLVRLNNGEINGDPVDVKMFEATKWELCDPEQAGFESLPPSLVKSPSYGGIQLEVAVIRSFVFASELQRMSVVTQQLGESNACVYCKGAPEMVASLCSTVPEGFSDRIKQFTSSGFRVLAIACRSLPPNLKWHKVQKMPRAELECQFELCGLLILQNCLKPASKKIVGQLRNSDIRVVMATGDHLDTAISVARECSMIGPDDRVVEVTASNSGELISFRELTNPNNPMSPQMPPSLEFHYAITGASLDQLIGHDCLQPLLRNCTVFARMKPHQKSSLVELNQEMNYIVAMCGDGANDCAALKTADVGVSLSQAEASVAAPFTSTIEDISCIPVLIREGRCALVTSFSLFKYMVVYSLVQFTSILILYTQESNLGDEQQLYVDMCTIFVLILVMGRTNPAKSLGRKRPPGRLVNPVIISSVVLQIIIQGVFQLTVFYMVRAAPWYYHEPVTPKSDNIVRFENTVIFMISNFQYVFVALVYSSGAPFRRHFITNYLFLLVTACLLTMDIIFVVIDPEFFQTFFQMKKISDPYFLMSMLGIIACDFMVTFFVQEYIVSAGWFKRLFNFIICKRRKKNAFKRMELGHVLKKYSYQSTTS